MPVPLDQDTPVRWGILGAGGIAHAVGRDIAASPGSVVQAVAARDQARAGSLAEELGADRGYGDYEQLLVDPDIDIVYVATTHGQHYPQVRAVLEAGKAALVEKSFTVNADQALTLARLAHEHDVFCMEAMWTRCLPSVRQAVLAAGNDIGRVIGIRTDLSRVIPYDPTSRLWNPATGGGVLLDMGVYVSHIAWAFLGEPEVVHTVGHRAPNGVDASAAMIWGYPDGSHAVVAASFEGLTDGPHTVVSGDRGWIALHGRTQEPTKVVVHRGFDEHTINVEQTANGFVAEIAEVERALRDGDLESPLVPLADTVGVLRVLDQARAALGVHYGKLEEV